MRGNLSFVGRNLTLSVATLPTDVVVLADMLTLSDVELAADIGPIELAPNMSLPPLAFAFSGGMRVGGTGGFDATISGSLSIFWKCYGNITSCYRHTCR